jgi:hypothetical protein
MISETRLILEMFKSQASKISTSTIIATYDNMWRLLEFHLHWMGKKRSDEIFKRDFAYYLPLKEQHTWQLKMTAWYLGITAAPMESKHVDVNNITSQSLNINKKLNNKWDRINNTNWEVVIAFLFSVIHLVWRKLNIFK